MADTPYAVFSGMTKMLIDMGDGTCAERFIGPRPGHVDCGQKKIATTGTAVALGSGVLFNGIIVTAKTTNTAPVFVGASGVTTTDDGTGNGYRLEPGQSISFSVADISALFINGTAGDSVYFAGN